jgi:2-polyprenyl-3-methyl-5-hydroxy-6-metoxy-1,4-benzoquinol methylase
MSGQAEFWDERYRGEGFAFGTEPNVFLASQASYLKPGLSALVPGDGQGRNGVWLAQRGLLVDTVDVSPLAVSRAQELAKARGVKLNIELADLTSWNWPQTRYDIVAALYVHFFDADRPRMHRAMLGALKPGGTLIMEAFRIEQLEMRKLYGSGGPKTADLLHSKAKLLSDFEGASILLLEDAIVELDEGHRHKGPAAVVRAVVQKPV